MGTLGRGGGDCTTLVPRKTEIVLGEYIKFLSVVACQGALFHIWNWGLKSQVEERCPYGSGRDISRGIAVGCEMLWDCIMTFLLYMF